MAFHMSIGHRHNNLCTGHCTRLVDDDISHRFPMIKAKGVRTLLISSNGHYLEITIKCLI